METETNINHLTMKINVEDVDEAFNEVEKLANDFDVLVSDFDKYNYESAVKLARECEILLRTIYRYKRIVDLYEQGEIPMTSDSLFYYSKRGWYKWTQNSLLVNMITV